MELRWSEVVAERGSIDEFLEDIEPFFYGRSLTYVDVGAFVGKVFKRVLASGLKVREAHLIEPNPASLQLLRDNIRESVVGRTLNVYGLAIGAERGRVRLRAAESMTKVVEGTAADCTPLEQTANLFEVECRTLDELAQGFTEGHVSLLKIDVEGFEDRVLAGAGYLLKDQRVDVIYIEVGMNPAGTQQCYYRQVDDFLLRHGYRLFKVYEQMHEWMDDAPFLRRVNFAYMSERFARNHPYRLTRELFEARKQITLAQAEVAAERRKVVEVQQSSEREAAGLQLELRNAIQTLAESGERIKALVEDVAKERRRATEAEMRQRLTLQERDELTTRLSRVALENQRDLQELMRVRVQLESVITERDELRLRNQRIEKEHKEALQQLATVRDDLDKVVRAEKERQSGEPDRALNALERERDTLKQKVTRLEQARNEAERMSRDVYRLFGDLVSKERRARADAALALNREARTRRHLSYRLGAVLVHNSKSAAGLLRTPFALARAYDEFRQDRAQFHPRKTMPAGEILKDGDSGVSLLLRPDWQVLVVVCTDTTREIWVHPYSVSSGAVVKAELVLDQLEGDPVVEFAAGEPIGTSAGAQFPIARTVDMRAGESIMLAKTGRSNGRLAIRLRKTRGEPCILRVELRGSARSVHSSPAMVSAPSTEQRRGGDGANIAALLTKKSSKPRTAASNTLYKAQQILLEGRLDEALAFALTNASDVERPAINLFQANTVGADDAAWLRHLNAYARRFVTAPIELVDGGSARFHRLRARPVREVHEGPVVSVIMPAFNAKATLELAAVSILNQTWKPLELIIIDDASEDDTWSIAQRIAATDARVKIYRNAANVGPYVSKNIALRVADGEFITGHDADDWAHPERIEAHLAMMRSAGPKVRASLSGMIRMTAEGHFARFSPIGPNTSDGALVGGFISCLFEARFLKEVLGGWDEVRFAGDSELIKRAERILGAALPRFLHLGMICLDSPTGLTNHPEYGYSPILGVSMSRKAYRDAFALWHETVGVENAFLPFPQGNRQFAVPTAAAVDPSSLAVTLVNHTQSGEADRRVKPIRAKDVCDVCIVTDLRFPGGNASSTLEEVRVFRSRGLRVLLVHCPSVAMQGKPVSARYEEFRDALEYFYNISAIETDALIVRHPAVASSLKFRILAGRIAAGSTAVIINNSIRRPGGADVYSLEALLANVDSLNSPLKRIYPLGPAIRQELQSLDSRLSALLARNDWTPTFDASQFAFRPKSTMSPPFVIGRHARDGVEKWIENPKRLLAAYPDTKEFSVSVLGGADGAAAIIGQLPANWEVLPFGSVQPSEYLARLDAFVYFPHTDLNEAFGRTIMEAIFSGVPCILPRRFQATFEEMAFYCEAEEVSGVIRRLGLHPERRLEFLRCARERAASYDSQVLHERLAALKDTAMRNGAQHSSVAPGSALLNGDVHAYKRWVETGRWSASPDLSNGQGTLTGAEPGFAPTGHKAYARHR
jgi:FkbM family methyltransferase